MAHKRRKAKCLVTKVTKRYLTENEARADGAYNIKKHRLPPDPWGTQVTIWTATVKEQFILEV
jgi:hypothetical protein